MKEEKIWAIKDGYLVHRDGSIYKLNWNRTKTMRKIKPCLNNSGYLYFNKNGKPYLIHRFVSECFLPNPKKLPEVNHKDENKTNNCVDNLEWCDRSYNVHYGTGIEKISKKVYQYAKNGALVKEWKSIHEIERQLGYFIQGISSCCNGELKSYKGFYWSFKPLADLSESNNSPRVR